MFNPHDIMQLLLKIFMWVSNHIRTYRVSQKKGEERKKIKNFIHISRKWEYQKIALLYARSRDSPFFGSPCIIQYFTCDYTANNIFFGSPCRIQYFTCYYTANNTFFGSPCRIQYFTCDYTANNTFLAHPVEFNILHVITLLTIHFWLTL